MVLSTYYWTISTPFSQCIWPIFAVFSSFFGIFEGAFKIEWNFSSEVQDDKRSKKSAELVVAAMDECLKAHDFSDLTITELCSVSTIGRATFYRLFDDLEDVVAYKCELFALEFSSEISGSDIKEIQLHFFNKWMTNIDFLKLIVSLKRTDIIFDCHRNHLEQLKPHFHKLGISEYVSDYHIVMLTNILIGALVVWCEHGCKESAEEVIASCSNAIQDIGLLFL